ncbi:SspB-related isopeptide-forming adhesin [Leuconostoc pseudomesenteroides]|uniref:SspB-related isopeptide-forming adhesin n=1 Tax=Leuconostoc pseudomesenteroides TaxID=33968 RepID=UPI0021A8A6A8|nr:SspB-related isopeptide-forming adhesin [Leuconostoc pseudomesenteroides]
MTKTINQVEVGNNLRAIQRYKMYKANGHWVVGSQIGHKAGKAVAVTTMTVGAIATFGIRQASADTTAATPTMAAPTLPTPTAPAKSANTGLNVEVPHTNVDSAAVAASEAGVKVASSAATTQTVAESASPATQQSIATDYNNQTKAIDKVTETQIANTTAYDKEKAAISTAQTAGDASLNQATDSLNSAASSAKNAGVVVTTAPVQEKKPAYQEPSNKDADSVIASNQANIDAYNVTVRDAVAAENANTKAVKEAQATQEANTKAYNDAVAATKSASTKGQDELATSNKTVADIEKAIKAASDQNSVTINAQVIKPKYEIILATDDAATIAKKSADNLKLYDDAIASAKAATQQAVSAAQEQLSNYQKEVADYNQPRSGDVKGATLDNNGWLGYYTPDFSADLHWEWDPATNTVKVTVSNVKYNPRLDRVTNGGNGFIDAVTLQQGNGGGDFSHADVTGQGVTGHDGHLGTDTVNTTESLLSTIKSHSANTLIFAADKQNATQATAQTGIANTSFTVSANPDGSFTLATFGRRGMAYTASGNADPGNDWEFNQKIVIPGIPQPNHISVDLPSYAVELTPPVTHPNATKVNVETFKVAVLPPAIKPADLSVTYQLHDLIVQPQGQKDDDINQDQVSDSGKLIDKNDTIIYSLKNDNLPANRTDNVKTYTITDQLDKNVHITQSEAQAGLNKQGLSDLYTVTVSGGNEQGGQLVTYTGTDKLLAQMNQDKTKEFKVSTIAMPAHVTNDNVTIDNKFTTTINDYHVDSNVVPNKTPNPKPTKEDLNLNGVNIDNKTVLPGTTNIYQLTWDLSSYKAITASDDQVKKGFFYIDDDPEEAVIPNLDKTTLTANGQAIKGVSIHLYQSITAAPQWFQDAMKAYHISPKGEFVAYLADDPEQFYKDYVETGENIVITQPMTVKDTFQGTYQNTAYQFDFVNGYATDTVYNNVPPMKATKSVDDLDGKDINHGNVNVGDIFKYVLHSPVIPATQDGLGEPLYDISGYDALNPTYDEYTGQYRFLNTAELSLKTAPSSSSQTALWNELKNTAIDDKVPVGTDLSKYISVTYGNYTLKQADTFVHDVTDINGKVYKAGEEVPAGSTIKDVFSWAFTQDFLDQLEPTSAMSYDVEIQAKRMAPTDGLENQATFGMNNVHYHTDKVVTKSIKPDVPKAPKTTIPNQPQTPGTPAQPNIPAAPQKLAAPAPTELDTPAPETVVKTATVLPQTRADQQDSGALLAAGVALGALSLALGLAGTQRKQKA